MKKNLADLDLTDEEYKVTSYISSLDQETQMCEFIILYRNHHKLVDKVQLMIEKTSLLMEKLRGLGI